jgi:uncharacterized membrane protein HdeD (DUF308 family)
VAEKVDSEARFLDTVIAPFVRDSMLWPILAVFVLHLVAGLSYALVFALREQRPVALLALLIGVWFTAGGVRTELRVRHRPAALSLILAITWLLSALAAFAGWHWQIF